MPPITKVNLDANQPIAVAKPTPLPTNNLAPVQVAHPPNIQVGNTTIAPGPGVTSVKPPPPSAPADNFVNQLHQFSLPFGGLASGIAKSTGQIAGLGVEDIRAIGAKLTNNEPAFQAAMKRGGQDIGVIKQAAQFIPRAGVQVAKSIASPTSPAITPKTPAEKFLLGAQPIQSLTQVSRQAGGGIKGAGTAVASGLADVLALAPVAHGAIRAVKTGAEAATPLDQEGSIRLPFGKSQNQSFHYEAPTQGITKISGKASDVRAQLNEPASTPSLPPGVKDLKTILAELTPLKGNEVGAVGKNVSAADDFTGKAKDLQQNLNPSQPKITPEAQSLYDSAPPVHLQKQGQGVTPNMITEADRREASYSSISPEELVGRRQASFRSVDGERAALDTLQNNGSRDDAIAAYRQVTGESQKMAAFRVQTAARQAEQALHPNVGGINPLEGTMDISNPRAGDYRQVLINGNKIEGRIGSASKDVQSFRGALTPNDRANFRDYVEGTRDINSAEDPATVRAATESVRNLTDTVHASDPLRPRYIQNFFPEYWDVAPDPLKAEQALEEEVGPEAWNNMSLDERRQMLAERTDESAAGDLGTETNYNSGTERGFHSKARVFANSKEGEAADLNHLNDDPFDDLQRYATGAKLDLKAKIIRRSADAADIVRAKEKGANNTVDLGGGKSIKVSDRGYRALKGLDVKDARGPVAKAWQGLTSAVTQFIILNPTIHGANLATQGFIEAGKQPLFNADGLLGKIPSGPIGGVRFLGNTVRLMASRGARQEAINRYLSDGGHIPTYGRNTRTILTEAADSAGLPHFSKTNAAAMSKIDGLFRSARHDDNIRMGVDPDTSIRSIDTFMGDQRAIPEVAKNMGLFYHWLRTEVNATVHTVVSPGAFTNAAILLAAMYGLNKAWQDITGNKNAHIRYPGELGLINEAYQAAKKHNAQTLTTPITNHVNPLITAGANQVFGKDEFTGQTLRTGKQRAQDVLNTTVAPAAGVQRVMSGKRSPAENALNLFGFYTPHATNAPAVPNATGKVASIINTPGAKPVKVGNDPTGYSQEINYYQSKDKALNSLDPATSQKTIDQFNTYLDHNHTPTGQTVLKTGPQSESDAKMLASSDQLLKTTQAFEKSQPNHDPKWDLTPAQLKTYFQYESITPGEKARTVMEQKNPWLVNTFNAEQTWFNQQQLSGNVVKPPGYINYPSLSQDQQNMMNQATALSKIDNRSPDQAAQLNALEQNPNLQMAYASLLKYTNGRRAQDGLQPIAADAQLTPQEEAALTYEGKLPSGTGAKTAFIKANQDLWNTIQNKLAAITMQSIASNGSIVYEGGTPSNSYLKDIYNAGKYDIAKGTLPGGGSTFVLNPELAYSGGTSGGATFAGSSTSGKGGKGGTKRLPAVKKTKIRRMKIRRAPRQRAKHVKLARQQKTLNIRPTQGIQPVQVARPTSVVKIA